MTGGPGTDADAATDAATPPVLQRLMARRAERAALARPDVERCEFCAEPVADDHRHVVDVEARAIRCSCRGCALLFDGPGAGGGRYRTVPDDHRRLAPFVLDPTAWAAMQVPVGVVFFMTSSATGTTTAFYPSPGGATESELPLDAWDEVVAANPPLTTMLPDVEAALVRVPSQHLGGDLDEPMCHVVPIDRCYELIGLLRLHWRGFDGGDEVRAALADFLDDVERRAGTVGEGAA